MVYMHFRTTDDERCYSLRRSLLDVGLSRDGCDDARLAHAGASGQQRRGRILTVFSHDPERNEVHHAQRNAQVQPRHPGPAPRVPELLPAALPQFDQAAAPRVVVGEDDAETCFPPSLLFRSPSLSISVFRFSPPRGGAVFFLPRNTAASALAFVSASGIHPSSRACVEGSKDRCHAWRESTTVASHTVG